MLFSEFLDHLNELGDDPPLANAWIESLSTRDRQRMLQYFATFHEALEGSELARMKARRIERQEARGLRRRARRCHG